MISDFCSVLNATVIPFGQIACSRSESREIYEVTHLPVRILAILHHISVVGERTQPAKVIRIPCDH